MARRSSFSPSGLGGLPRFFGLFMGRIVVTHKRLDKPIYCGTIYALGGIEPHCGTTKAKPRESWRGTWRLIE